MFISKSQLVDTNKSYIKPIFIQMCMGNDQLCDWLISNYIFKENISHVKFNDISLFATFIKC